MDIELLYLFWPLILAVSWAIFALSFVVLDNTAVLALRVLSIIGFIITAIFVLFGIGT